MKDRKLREVLNGIGLIYAYTHHGPESRSMYTVEAHVKKEADLSSEIGRLRNDIALLVEYLDVYKVDNCAKFVKRSKKGGKP